MTERDVAVLVVVWFAALVAVAREGERRGWW